MREIELEEKNDDLQEAMETLRQAYTGSQDANDLLMQENKKLHKQVNTIDERLKEINTENKFRMDELKKEHKALHDAAEKDRLMAEQQRLMAEQQRRDNANMAKQLETMQQQIMYMMATSPSKIYGETSAEVAIQCTRKRQNTMTTPTKTLYNPEGGMLAMPTPRTLAAENDVPTLDEAVEEDMITEQFANNDENIPPHQGAASSTGSTTPQC